MKTIYKLFAVILLSSFCSCTNDFLDGAIPTVSSFREVYINDLETSEAYLNGIYVSLGDYFYHGLNMVYPELAADNIKPYPGNSALTRHYSWSQLANFSGSQRPTTSAQNLNSQYQSGYLIIRSCNYLLEIVDKFRNEDPARANRIKGQSLTIRALLHHNLVCAFAQPYQFTATASHPGIPYITVSDYSLGDKVARNTVSEVYENIVEDLTNSIELLDDDEASNKFYVTPWASKALLARVSLFMRDYESTKMWATEVSSAIPLMSVEDYPSKLFTLEDAEAEEESIFYLPPSSVTYSTVYSSSYFRQTPNPVFLATNDIASIITDNPDDKRTSWVTQSGVNWQITKFPISAFPDIETPSRAYCHPVIRSSELYLSASEACAKLGDEINARNYLDAVRLRANANALPSTETGQALLDIIYEERRKELAFEGFRLFDLLRLEQGIFRTDAPNPEAVALPYPSSKTIAPLPANEGMSQNEDY